MAEDSTRKLLRVFGMAVTDCEDALARLAAAVGEGPGTSRAAPETPEMPERIVAALEAYGRAARELSGRWVEVSRLILDYHARVQQALETRLRSGGAP